ncbi:MAG: hypothetical protein AVDCRST_MAG93-8528, partial [uncultured Chloroflexia bacterium]
MIFIERFLTQQSFGEGIQTGSFATKQIECFLMRLVDDA